jgi:hypothetical protein
MLTLPSSLEAYIGDLKTAHADRIFKATDPRTSPLERREYLADAQCIERELGLLITWGSTYVRSC